MVQFHRIISRAFVNKANLNIFLMDYSKHSFKVKSINLELFSGYLSIQKY